MLVKRVKIQPGPTGMPPYGLVMIMDFPDREALKSVFASEAYAAIFPARNKGFSTIDISFGTEL